jgi:energy-coupling factor transporter ATP-binding protein EcfA2/energy-coupling factor transporter transmembrane protein EcfT
MPIEVTGLTVCAERRSGRRLLEDMSFTLEDHTITLLVGRSGSGKTTLLRALSGLAEISGGSICYDGSPLWSQGRLNRSLLLRSSVAFQFPEHQLFARTVQGEFDYSLRPYGISGQEKADRVSRAMNGQLLPESLLGSSPFTLSGGQKRRTALATIAATEPQWLLLDEPSAGLDAVSVTRLKAELTAAKRHSGIVLSCHDLDAFLPVADRVLVLCGGRIAADVTPAQLYADPRPLLAAGVGLSDAMELAAALAAAGFAVPAQARSPQQMAAAIAAGLAAAGQHAAQPRASADAAQRVAQPRDGADAAQRVAQPRASADAAQRVAQTRASADAAQRVAQTRAGADAAQRVAPPRDGADEALHVAPPRAGADAAQRVARPRASADEAQRVALPRDGADAALRVTLPRASADAALRVAQPHAYRVDARVKWLVYTLVSAGMIAQNEWTGITASLLLALGCLLLLNGADRAKLWRMSRPLLWFTTVAALISGVQLNIGVEGVKPLAFSLMQAEVTIRNLLVFWAVTVIGIVFSICSSPSEMKMGLQSAFSKLPFRTDMLAVAASLVLRFIPLILEETERFAVIAKARGKRAHTRGLIHMRDIPVFVIPLLVSLFQSVEELIVAMELKGYMSKSLKPLPNPFASVRTNMNAALIGFIVFGLLLALRLYA